MKKLLLLLCIALVSISSYYAQNWSPVTSNETFYFQSDLSNFISHSVYLDSVIYNDFDSTFYFNRILKECDTCFSEVFLNDYYELEGTARKINQESFFGTHVVVSDDSHWEFQGEHPFSIETDADLSESWLFNEEGTVAEIIDLDEIVILGTLDSIKTIGLSSGQNILLSKNHGIISMPNFHLEEDESVFEMVGIKERAIGLQLLDFEDIFSYEVGDIFQYRKIEGIYLFQISSSQYTRCSGVLKLKVLEVNSSFDFIDVIFQRTVGDTCENLMTDQTYYDMYQDTVEFTYSRASYISLKENPNKVNLSNDVISPIDHQGYFEGESNLHSYANLNTKSLLAEDDKTIEYFGSYNYFEEQKEHETFVFQHEPVWIDYLEDPDIVYGGTDEMLELLYSGIGFVQYSYVGFSFGVDLGISSYEYSRSSANQAYHDDLNASLSMNAYSINGGSAGEIIPDDVLLSIDNYTASDSFEINIYPNPANETVNIDLGTQRSKDFEVIIYDATLQAVKVSNELKIDIQDLPSGIYFMQIETKGQIITKKIVIE